MYYGCGLRLNEGICLELADIDQTRRTVHVRMGKQYKERIVPIAEKAFEDLKLYIEHVRPKLLLGNGNTSFFLNIWSGKKIGYKAIYIRIKKLGKLAGIKKTVAPHTLRHSIATHLLRNGMKIEQIKNSWGIQNLTVHKSIHAWQTKNWILIGENDTL